MIRETRGQRLGWIPALAPILTTAATALPILPEVGKVTSPITTKIAKAILPDSWVDWLATIDPTKKSSPAPQQVIVQPQQASMGFEGLKNFITDPAILMVAGGSALVILLFRKKNGKRR